MEAEQISLAPENPLAAANDILDQQNEMWWIETLMGGRYSYSIVQGVEFDERQLRKVLLEMEAFQRRNMTAPTDASIGDFSPETGQYEVIPELKGTWLDADAAVTAVSNAILVHGETVDLEQQACYIEPEVTAQDEELLAALEEANRWVGAEITYDWNGSEVIVDGELIKEWILFEDGKAVLDEEAVAEFVADNARQYDTYGKVRTFRTTAGTELNLGSGAFGWKTDREGETAALMELIREGASVSREPVYAHTAPQKGMNDIGSSYVEADLTHQHLYLYHQGELVLETDFVSGIMSDPSCVTPQGVFGLTYKTTNAVLRGQNYATPVNYWMPFHGNYGMHDATWRSEFGGEIYLTNGSHGCLNLPLDAASQLYQYLYTGYPVICYY